MATTKKTLRTCDKGHQYYKSSDCPTCPICEQERKPKESFLSVLAAPAGRALENKGITSLKELSNFSEEEILNLHGMGASSIPKLRSALKASSLSFRKAGKAPVAKAKNIDEYILNFPKDTQKALEQIRTTIKKAAPGAEEIISYAIPAFKFEGHYLVYFAGYKNHIGLYPAPRGSEAFKEELSLYKGGKGTVQFPLNKSMPLDLITRIVKFRIKENQERVKRK